MQSYTPDTADSLDISDESAGAKFFAKLLTREPSSASSASASFAKQQSVRRSFSLFPDLSSLIRSHSTSSRRSAALQSPDITSSAFFSGYADPVAQFAQPEPVTSSKPMLSKHNEERPSRKLKSENRLYNFLTRSRSRSRSKNEPPSAEPSSPMPDLPPKSRSSRRLSSAPTDSPGSKPPSRLQSRPLSSTTTATNTTITPGTPKARTQRPAAVTPTNKPIVLDSPSPHRPTTPSKPSGARQKLHDFFSIPLGRKSSTSRSRSRSRPSSPRASLDVPPLPIAGAAIDDDPTPRPRKSFASPPPLRPRSPSPTPEPKVLRVTNATTTSSSTGSTTASASIKISKFFSSKGPEPSLPKPKQPPTGPPVLPPIPAIVKRVSSLHRRTSLKADSPAPVPAASASGSAVNLGLNVNLGPPKITHTPPTPLKNPSGSSSTATSKGSGASGSGSGSASGSGTSSARLGHAAKGSLDSSYRYRGGMGVVDEEGAPSSSARKGKARLETGGSASGHGHDHPSGLPLPLPRPGLKMSSAARATKHGSFDFERPGWGGGAPIMQRNGSNGTTNSGWSKTSEKERESTYGPGLAGVGTLQRDLSVKRAQDREEMVKLKERARRGGGDQGGEKDGDKERGRDREREKEKERPSTSQRTTPGSTPTGSEHVHGSTSTAGTGNGKTSSMSKATGVGGRRALLKTSSGTGVTRLIGLSPAQHPPFSFEPAVPSPTRSTGTASTGTAHEVPSSWATNGKAERERERVREEKERLMGRRGSAVRRGDRAPVPVPVPAVQSGTGSLNAHVGMGVSGRGEGYGHGHRSGTKGRSLDLGLGLAWAPSKVREEALLPSSGFFARSASGSSHGQGHAMARSGSGSTTRSASGTGTGSGRSRGDGEGERSKLGREVAEVFKNALDPEGYKLFRTYVHQFDAHEIPFDGPMGIVSRVEHLLVSAPHLGDEGKRRLLDKFVRIILQQA